jgi:hypothetical protein
MRADETELRRHLNATAAGAGAPRFTAGEVAVRVWRLRRRRARAGAGSAAAAVVAAAVAIPLWLGATAPAGTSVGEQPSAVTGASRAAGSASAGPTGKGAGQSSGVVSSPAKAVPPPAWTVTFNGRTARTGTAAEPQFGVARGEHVSITITVTVPAHDQMTKLFLGITGDSAGIGPRGPIGMSPVLATAAGLGPGKHAFTVHWAVPTGAEPVTGYQLALAAYWPRGTTDEPQAEEVPMVTFVTGT